MLLCPRRRRGPRGRGNAMGASKRRRIEPTHEWQLLLPLFEWPEQERYEQIRPLVLFDASVAERAAEVGTSTSTLYRRLDRFAEEGMESLFDAPAAKRRRLPPSVRRLIVDLKAEYPAFNLNEIANVVGAAFGRKPDVRSVERVLSEEPLPLNIVRNYPPYHESEDVREARAAVVALRLDGWSVKAIAGYLGVHHSTVYRALERWKEKGFEGLADGSPGRPPSVKKADFAAVEAIRKLAQNPGFGAFRVHAAMRQMGFDLSRATCGRILAMIREVYGYEKPEGGGKAERMMPFAATKRHQIWSADVWHLDMVDESLVGSKAHAVTVMDNYSRAILSSAVTRRQDLFAFLSVLYRAVERYGARPRRSSPIRAPCSSLTGQGRSTRNSPQARWRSSRADLGKTTRNRRSGSSSAWPIGSSGRQKAGRNSPVPTTGSSRTTTPKATSLISGARTAGAPRQRSSFGSQGCASTRRTSSRPSSPSASLASWTPRVTPP